MSPRRPSALPVLIAVVVVAVSACKPEAASRAATVPAHMAVPAARTPAQALQLLVEDLRHDDLGAFLAHAVPASRLPALRAAWREGRTQWPLTELPFADRLPQLLTSLARPGAQQALQSGFNARFAGRDAQLRNAARALGIFGEQYVGREPGFSPTERAHYTQCLRAVADWAQSAPLGDRQRAASALHTLTLAARATGLVGDAAFARQGLDDTLRRMAPFLAAVKQVSAHYGLDLNASLASVQVEVVEASADAGLLRMRYVLGGHRIEARVPVRRVEGRWYLADYLDRIDAALRPPPPTVPASPERPPAPPSA